MELLYNQNVKYLIINADDFGKFQSVNEGILEGIDKGIITSTSLMVYGKFAEDINNIVDKNTSVGLHFDPSKFHPKEYKDEFFAQLELFKKIAGRKPDHIDSHKIRMHEMNNIIEVVKDYSVREKVPLREMGFANFIDSFFALSRTDYKTIDSSLVSPNSLIKILENELKEGFNEMMCHAGRVDREVVENSSYSKPREVELNTLLSKELAAFLSKNPEIQLKSWRDVIL